MHIDVIQNGYTALMFACENSDFDGVVLLLQYKHDIHMQNKVKMFIT